MFAYSSHGTKLLALSFLPCLLSVGYDTRRFGAVGSQRGRIELVCARKMLLELGITLSTLLGKYFLFRDYSGNPEAIIRDTRVSWNLE